MYSLYALCLYGISLNQVQRLLKDGFTLIDFEEQTEKINNLGINRPTLVHQIKETIPSIKYTQRKDNLYQLAHEGLSELLIDQLIQFGINYHDLNNLTLEKYNEMVGGNRKSSYKKIMTSFKKVESNKERIPHQIFKELILEILSNLNINEAFTVEKIGDKILRNHGLKVNQLLIKSTLYELHDANQIEFYGDGVIRKYPKLMDYMETDFRDKEIFIKRLHGVTAEKLATDYEYSRQGIYNIEKRVIKRMPVFKEDLRYREFFEQFDFPQELFIKIFKEPMEVYSYLDLKYKKGNKSLLDDVSNPKFTELHRKLILRYYNCFINKLGEIKEISKVSIFEDVIAKYALNAVTDAEIVEKYNEYIIKNNLPKSYLSEESSIRGISDRCENSIRGKGNTYRFYDFNVITNDVIANLKEFLVLDPGVYSMKKIFRDNPEFMEEIDIRTEYELHNLYRRMVDIANIYYTRMPEFTVGNIDKREFFIQLFHEYSPIHLKEFIVEIEEVYGLRQDSLASYVKGYLNDYIHGDIIKTTNAELLTKDFQKLKSMLNKPIYTIEEVKKIGRSIGDDFTEKFINNTTLSKVGYKLRSNFVLSNNYNSIDDYFRCLILSDDYFINEHFPVYQTRSFNAVIYSLEKDFRIFKVEKDMYITFKKLSEVGITSDDVMDYRRSLLQFIEGEEHKYFTLYSIKEEGFEHPLDELGFSDLFYERLIWAFEEFRAIQTTTGYIIKKTETNLSLREFLYDYISERRMVKLEELIDDVTKVYGIILEANRVIYLLRQTDVFYSEELYKFYIDEEDFFEEVYE